MLKIVRALQAAFETNNTLKTNSPLVPLHSQVPTVVAMSFTRRGWARTKQKTGQRARFL